MRTLHLQQRCVPPPFHIDRRVDVGVVDVTTADVDEARLALAAPRINYTAGGAGLARKAGRHLPGLNAGASREENNDPPIPRHCAAGACSDDTRYRTAYRGARRVRGHTAGAAPVYPAPVGGHHR